MKLGITGSRSITEFDFLPYFMMQNREFRLFCRRNGLGRRKITAVITGGARGIDTLAFQAAEKAGIRNLRYLPDRTKFRGKTILKAFQARNEQIVDGCDVLLAVWDGRSRGTANTLSYARKVDKPVFLIRMEDQRRGARSAA